VRKLSDLRGYDVFPTVRVETNVPMHRRVLVYEVHEWVGTLYPRAAFSIRHSDGLASKISFPARGNSYKRPRAGDPETLEQLIPGSGADTCSCTKLLASALLERPGHAVDYVVRTKAATQYRTGC